MIIVANRELLIPKKEQYIGTTYDKNSEYRQFMLDRVTAGGVDLANLLFTLDMEYMDGNKNAVVLDKQVLDDKIILTWLLLESELQITGTTFINIRAVNNTDGLVKWSSFRAPVYIEDTIFTPGHYTGDLTELEQMEAAFQLDMERNQDLHDMLTEAEEEREEAENDRVEAENAREEAEAEREAAFNTAIDDFNNDRQELKDWHDSAWQAAEDAERYKDLCEMYADIVVPVFHVDFDDGELKYNDGATFIFTVNTASGDLEYTYVPG